jgi:hypothetical protein
MMGKMCVKFAANLLLGMVSICAAADTNADTIAKEKEIRWMEQLAYPTNSSMGFIKWAGNMRVLLLADDPQDSKITIDAFEELQFELPENERSKLELVASPDTAAAGWFDDAVLIRVAKNPYSELNTSLKPVYQYLSVNSDAALISQNLISENPPSHSIIRIHRSGAVAGQLLIIRSDLPLIVKRDGLFVGLIDAICPTLSAIQGKTGLFEKENGIFVLSKFGRDFVRIILTDEVKPGMTLSQFDSLIRQTL